MKYYVLFYCAIASLFTVDCFAQEKEQSMTNLPSDNNSTDSDDLTIVSYHVVETIKKQVGSSITSYDVSSLNMINTNDLGPNNTRIITPKYIRRKAIKPTTPIIESVTPIATAVIPANTQPSKIEIAKEPTAKELAAKEEAAKKEKAKIEAAKIEAAITEVVKEEITKKEALATKPVVASQTEAAKVVPKKKENYVNIDIIETYERVLDKGFKSVDMLKKVGDRHFFNDELVAAAKWYGQLFEITTDFDTIYYYRYAKSLEAINQPEKASQMMAIFKTKSN
jgi:hypothetical protein